jgi:hypothetical protein
MWRILQAKFADTNSQAYTDLMSTGDALLFENSPKDIFWGIGYNGFGLNILGKLLMLLRAEKNTQMDKKTRVDEAVLAGIFPAFREDALSHIPKSSVAVVTVPAPIAGWPAPVFVECPGGKRSFDARASLKGFLGRAEIACVRLWGSQNPKDLWIITYSDVDAATLVKNIKPYFTCYQPHMHKYCVIVPAASAVDFMQTLSRDQNNKTIEWMTGNPDTRYQGQDIRPK